MAQVYNPQISVILKKNITRTSMDGQGGIPASDRYKGAFKNGKRELDLTPFLGEAGGVHLHKNIREPAGAFSIALTADIVPGLLDSLYGLVEPLDVIEFRMAHDTSQAAYIALSGNMPLVMRGIVSNIERMEVMTPGGKPSRGITLTGQDYGKFWQIMQIAYLPNYTIGQQLLTYFKYAANYQPNAQSIMRAADFVGGVVDNVLNPFIAKLREDAGNANNQNPIQLIGVQALTVKHGTVFPFGVNTWQGGSVYELLKYHGDVGPFNEMYIEDQEDAVAVVYRPAPMVDVSGNLIQADAAMPARIKIPDADIVSLAVRRSDENLGNCFWVDSPRFQLNQKSLLQLVAATGDLNSFISLDHQNCTPTLYGLRKMECETQQGGDADTTRGDGQSESLQDASQSVGFDWIQKRRDILKRSNWDNVVLETGRLRVRGNEQIKPGMMVDIVRRNFTESVYAVGVDQEFVPFQGYFTNITFERGTGFIERSIRKEGKNSPYYSELNAGGA